VTKIADSKAGGNFINVLQVAFTHIDHKTDGLIVFFRLLGSASVKSAHAMLVKLTPGSIPIKLIWSLKSLC
jgi:hypothetical protein